MKKTININFADLLTGVQKAFAGRTTVGVALPGSGEKAIAGYFNELEPKGVEIALDNAALKNIASSDKKVTEENLQALLNAIGYQTKDQAEELAKQQEDIRELMNIDVVSGSTKKRHQERKDAYDAKSTVAIYQNPKDEKDQESNSLMAGGTTLPSGKTTANNLIIKAYNECVTEKSMTESDFVKKLFGESFTLTPKLADLMKQSKEVFKSLHSQYGNNEIKDNLAKVEKDPTTWEKIKDFISNLLSYVGVNLGTNAGDKDKYKANKPESKSLLDHAAKKPLELGK